MRVASGRSGAGPHQRHIGQCARGPGEADPEELARKSWPGRVAEGSRKGRVKARLPGTRSGALPACVACSGQVEMWPPMVAVAPNTGRWPTGAGKHQRKDQEA